MISVERRVSRMSAFGIAVLCVALAVIPFLTTTTSLRQASQIIVSVLAVLGVNVATGYGGMISLGHGVFVGVGAFATGYYVDDLSMPWLLAITLGAATAGIAGAFVGIPALRIKGIHLALVTLGLAIVFRPLSKRFPSITGGVSGRSIEARFDAPGWWPGDGRMASSVYRYVFCVLIVVLALWATWNVVNSRFGRSMRALRDNDTAAAVYGIDLVSARVTTFAISAGLAGLCGALQVVLVPFVSQDKFPAQESLVIYASAVVGGLGTIWGSVLGVVARTVVAKAGDAVAGFDGLGPIGEFFDLLDESAFVFGLGLIVLTFLFPTGLAGIGRKDRLRK
ncbi:MAG: branched-chain amino acid ABC transporter permease [Acidimicrobiales bacterium]|nr:MAG: branched-chain amino acid ABC transporter permease [Acidimicrobiales bacterium]